ncbi:electron transfer flavoprotein subunit alpha/FixB family protein [Dyadobacter chenwenxiniae]|uniref:Electron transfer flavoprotein subunit alpha/FixB family protein n=1 Tax=Dyadobacter chenwenxiniae TaxID=2906456 RepID=A0A9X1TEG8_9BACT|nr:electron transfer flavoprotein subunit alpha/FixB family protein [Dyadobacter chenwenxiniae]MCF0050705.1 electron transfer flavoprotein subunit alpha/FixB family protein [Dyadobacter chenwenxiniae]MCF0063131.1 electron transfer flavoprotein subunit alpha/FixB family protein [Dyadobacter chenwenxiniae]UON84699.1 electron transfer flavoprotein subunit alpha/FixB family protein [Dyadobacter chenwenxiniae]
MSVLIYVELDNGSIKKTSLEAVAYGAKVAENTGDKAVVLAIGQAASSELEIAGKYGASKVLHASDEKLSHENSLAYADVLAQAAGQEGSKIIILSKSGLGDAMAARAAAKLKAGVVSGVTALPEINGSFKVTRGIFTGKAFATTEMKSDIKILVVKKNVIEIDENDVASASAVIETFSPQLRDADFQASVVNVEKASSELSLTEAQVIVSGGRGMKGPEHWQPLLDLARALGAATGCSKPVSDLDWRPHHEHIGQTGIKVAPNLYIACGISGAIQHLAGVNGSKCIVVINKDPEAPFFKAADYGIVGDVFEILPKLTEAAKNM